MKRLHLLAASVLLTGSACQTLGAALKTELPLKVGNTQGGFQQGLWRYYHASDSGGRDGLRAMGDYERDKPDGRWTYYYPLVEGGSGKGTVQWEVGFEDEAFHGPTSFYHPDGELSAKGAFRRGLESGSWTFHRPGGAKVQEGEFTRGRRSGHWRYWDEAGRPVAEGQRDGKERRGRWRFWQADGTGYEADFTQPRGDGPWPSDELLAALDVRPPIPIQPQPDLTMLEEEIRDYLVELYTVGRDEAKLPQESEFASQSSTYGSAAPGKLKYGNAKRGEDLAGRELPVRYLADPEGRNLDLLEPASRGRWSVLVILRGQTDEVCIYCMAQTESLALSKDEFDRRGAEITMVYPGPGERLGAFRTLFRSEFGSDPDLGFAYDEDFALVAGLDISDTFALPTTLIIDERGVIRFAYVGLRIDDRPAANQILEKLDELRSAR